MVVRCEGVSGAIADFVCFHCPLVASAEAKPLLAGKTSRSVAPIWRDNVQVVDRAAWGASADAQSYGQGRFAACTFVERVWHTGRPRNSWGVAPNPTRELRPLTPQGALPLDPFWAARLGCACLIVRTCCLYPKSALHMTRCPGRHRAPPSPSNPVSDPHTRGLSLPESSHCPTISAGTSQF